jgi:hypothetical protein
MWKRATAALMTGLVVGCATPERVQAPEQVPAPAQLQTPESVQTPEQAQALERQKREQYQKRVAAEKKRVAAEKERVAAEKERIAEHLQRDLAPVCTSAGLTPGTDAHARCVDSLYRRELERASASSRK